MLVLLISNFSFGQTTVTIGGGGTITCNAVPTATYTTPPSGVTFSNWSRGSGVTCASASAGLSGSGFSSVSAAAAVTSNLYYAITISANSSTSVNLSSVVWNTAVSSGTGNFAMMYSNNGGTVTQFGSTGTSTSSNSFSGSVTIAPSTSLVLYFVPYGCTGSSTVRLNNASTITVTATSAYTTTAAGDWNTGSTWVGGSVPPAGATCNVNHAVTLAASLNNTGVINVNSGGSLQLNAGGYVSGNSIVYAATGSGLIFNNSSSYGINSGQAFWPTTNPPYNVTISGSGATTNMAVGAVAGTLTLNAALTANTAVTVNGTLQINSGGSVNTNAPVYGSSSTLVYSGVTSYGVGTEWTGNSTTAGSGVPQNVTLQSSATVTMPSSSRGLAGNMNISSGTLSLSTTSGADIYVAGNWTVGATASQTNNSRAVFFNGASGTQVITKIGAGVVFFDYLIVNKAAGSVQLSSSPATTVTLNIATGGVLQLTNAGTLDLNGQSITLNNNGGEIQVNASGRTITSSTTGGTINITGTKTVTGAGTLIIGSNVTTVLTKDIDFGSSKTTIQGTLQVNGGGFVSNNAPIYANTSTLVYNGVTTYGVNNEWTGNASTAGLGVPQNVTLTSSSLTMPASSSRGLAGNLLINSGSTLPLGTSVGGDLSVAGNFTNSGTFTPNSRLVTFNGAAPQTITGATTFDYLTLNNSTGLTLANNVTVNQTLALTSGKITLGNNTLTIASGGTITGASSSNYIVESGTGVLKKSSVGNSATLFPIGLNTTNYTPITLTNTTGTSDLSVLVGSSIANAVNDATKVVNLQWTVTSSAATTATVTPVWVAGNQAGSFTNTGSGEIGNYISSAYTIYPTTLSTTTTTATGVALQSGTNLIVVGDSQAVSCTTPTNISVAAASILTSSSLLTWTNPSCYDEIMIVARAGSANDGTPTGNGSAYTSSLAFGSGTALGSGFVVYKGSTSSQTVTGLTNGTTYYFKLFTRRGSNWSSGYEVSATPSVTYCTPETLNCTVSDYISNVTFNTLNNTSVCSDNTAAGYSTYAATGTQTTTVTAGSSYNLTLSSGSGTGTHGAAVWIDFNNNGVFTDSGEYFLISNSISPSTTTTPISIAIPSGATVGTTRMRVRYIYSTTITSSMYCTSAGTYGETEDYTITIAAPCTQPTTQATIGAYTANTTGTSLTVNWTRGNGTGGVIVVARATATTAVNPSQGTTYTPSATGAFNGTTTTGTGNVVIYNGTGTSVNVTSLTAGTSYTFSVYEYNTASVCYSTPSSSSAVTTCTTGTPSLTIAAVPSGTICSGTSVTFTASPTNGGTPTYQWKLNGTNVGTSSTTYTNASLANGDVVTCTMTNAAACTTTANSNTITMSVSSAPTTAAAGSNQTICSGATVTLAANTAAIGTGVWTVSGPSSLTSQFSSTSSPTAVFTPAGGVGVYTLTWTISNSPCTASTSSMTVTVNGTPSAVTITPATSTTFCVGGSVSLTASGGTVTTTATLGSGSSVTTSATSSSTLGPNPMESYYGGSKQQMLVTASELSALGMSAGSVISSLAFNMSAVESRTLNSYVVKMQHTSLTSFASTSFVTSGFTTVRTAANLTPVAGWNTIPFNTNFTWNGTSNLLIEINFSNNDSGGTGTNTAIYSSTSFASTLFYRVDSTPAATVDAATTASFSAYSSRNNMQFVFTAPASFAWSPSTGLSGTSGATVTATPSTTTTYTATSTVNGCSSNNTVLVTVNQNHTISLTSGSSTPSVCINTALGTNIVYTVGGGGTGAGVTGLPSGMSGSFNAGTFTISGTPTVAGTFNYTVTTTGNSCTVASATGTITVNPIHTISLTSGSSTPSAFCINTALGTNIVYTFGGGATGAGVTGLPSGMSGNVVGSTFTISGTPTVSGSYPFTVTTTGNGCTVATATGTITVTPLVGYANLQYPPNGTICNSGTFTAYGQVYLAGITPGAGQGGGITVQFGYNSTNTDPSTWTNWSTATYNVDSGNNDEYKYVFSPPASGTYYYTFRYSNGSCGYQYGGYTATGGGFWDGTTNVSGVLTVDAIAGITSVTAAASPICASATTTLTANGVVGKNAVVTWYSGTGGTGTNYGTGLTLSNKGPGTYYARVTADCGSAVEASVTVGSKTNVSITSATATASPICSSATTTLTANGVAGTNASVTWYTGTGGTGTNLGTGLTLNGVGPGTYYARVTGDCGSAVEASVTVGSKTNVAITSATAASSSVCSGGTTTLTANGVVGTNATVTWYSGSGATGTNYGTGLTLNGAGVGTYYAYVTGDCGTPAQASVTVGTKTTVGITSATAASSSVCSGGTTSLTANGVVGTNATVTWYSGTGATGTNYGTGLTLNGAGAGTYYAYVTGDCGTPAEASVTVGTKTNVGITSATAASSSVCSGGTTTLTANGVVGTNATVTWYSGSGATGSTLGTGSTLSGVGAGTYYAYVTGDCGTPAEASVAVGTKTNVGITSATAASSSVCSGGTTTLTANGVVGTNATVTWYSGTGATGTNYGTGSTLSGVGAGTYYAYVTGDCGTPAETSVTVGSNTNVGITSATAASSSVCSGGTTTLTANGVVGTNATVTWYSGSGATGSTLGTGSTLSGVGAGTYYAYVTGDCGTPAEASVTVGSKTNVSITSVTSDSSSLCTDSTTTIYANGVAGDGATIGWYSAANGLGSYYGATSTITQGPGTYYAYVTGDCGSPAQASVTISEKTTLTMTSVSADSTSLCSGSTTSIYANGVGGTNALVTWYTASGATGTNLGTGTTLTNRGAGTYYAYATGDCGSPIELSITINGLDSVGITSATAATSPICSDATTTITANGVTGTNAVVTWYIGTDTSGSSLGTGNSVDVGPGTYYAYVTGDCGTPVGTTVTVDSYSGAAGGTVSSDQTICSGKTPTALTLSGYTGTVQKWQKSSDASFTSPIDITNTTSTLSGATMGALTTTTYYRAVVNSGTCSTAYSAYATISVGVSSTWDGTSWDVTPNGSTSLNFAGNYSSTADLSGCSCTVTSGAVVMNSANDMLLTGPVTVTGGSLTFSNNSNLLQSDPSVVNTGNIIVKRNTNSLLRLDYVGWSSPVAGQNLLSFSPQTQTTRFYTYNTSTDQYNAISSPSTTTFGLGNGYLIRVPNNHTSTAPGAVWQGSFTGVPHNGTVDVTLSTAGNGYNMVGNPYPSTIDLNQFVADNSSVIDGTLYFWRKTNLATHSAYSTWAAGTFTTNSEGVNPNDVLQVGQGFFVKSTGGSSVQFNNSQRIANHGNQTFKGTANTVTTTITRNRFWLNMTSANNEFSQMAVGYNSNSSQSVEFTDGKRFVDGTIALSSYLNNDEYTIQGRALPFDSNDVVPLVYMVTNAGTYTISIDHVDGFFTGGGQEIFIKDNLYGTYTSLTAGNFTFTTDAGTYNDRFQIVYQTALAVGHTALNSNNVIIYKQNGDVVVNTGNIIMDDVKIFDIRGRLLLEKSHINQSETRMNVGDVNQVLIVKVTSVDNEVVNKKVIN